MSFFAGRQQAMRVKEIRYLVSGTWCLARYKVPGTIYTQRNTCTGKNTGSVIFSFTKIDGGVV